MRHWLPVWLAWVVVLVLIAWQAPPLDSVVKTGEFAFLPADSPSLVGEQLFSKAFPNDLLASSVVIVVRRTSQPGGLQEKDWDFVDDGVDDDDPTRNFDSANEFCGSPRKKGAWPRPTKSVRPPVTGLTSGLRRRLSRASRRFETRISETC